MQLRAINSSTSGGFLLFSYFREKEAFLLRGQKNFEFFAFNGVGSFAEWRKCFDLFWSIPLVIRGQKYLSVKGWRIESTKILLKWQSQKGILIEINISLRCGQSGKGLLIRGVFTHAAVVEGCGAINWKNIYFHTAIVCRSLCELA